MLILNAVKAFRISEISDLFMLKYKKRQAEKPVFKKYFV